MKAVLLTILMATVLAAPVLSQQADNSALIAKSDSILKDLASLPAGIEVSHFPSPVYARYDSTAQWKYNWTYKTTVRPMASEITVTEFGMFTMQEGRWVLGNYTGAPFTRKDFAKWYRCADAKLEPGSSYSDPSNWTAAGCLRQGMSRWYFIGTDSDGKRFRGEAVIEQVARVQE